MSDLLHRIAAFLWLEADLLDQKDYAGWLDLWDAEGLYIVPIGREPGNYADRLNYAYDDAAMRSMRVRRLTNGESVSAASAAITVRTVSRFRLLGTAPDGVVTVRCAQALSEYRNGLYRPYAADVTWQLRPDGDSFRIREKVVLLANSTDALAGITFLP